MFYEKNEINSKEEDIFSFIQLLNNCFGSENFLNPVSNEESELNYLTPDISTLSNLNNSETHIIQIPNHPNENKNLGRKRKDSGQVGKHDEYAEDNMIRKSKKLFRDAIFKLINTKIENLKFELVITIDKKKYNVKRLRLLNLGQTLIKESSVEENIALFLSPVKILFYEISGKYKDYPKNYNIAAIEELCRNPNCQEIADILNLDFLDCLKYYRRDEDALDKNDLKILNNLELEFDDLPNKLKNHGYDEAYEEKLIYVIKNLESIYCNKNSRERRK